MKAYYWETIAKPWGRRKYRGVAFASSLYELFWTIDISLNPYAVKFYEIKSGSLVEVFGNSLSKDVGFTLRGNENWRVFKSEDRTIPFDKEKMKCSEC